MVINKGAKVQRYIPFWCIFSPDRNEKPTIKKS
ncbi:MAG: hypothetical protein ACI9WT_002243, partial [Flavobacterium sp.]